MGIYVRACLGPTQMAYLPLLSHVPFGLCCVFLCPAWQKCFMQFLAPQGVPQGLLDLFVSAVCARTPHLLSEHLSVLQAKDAATSGPACSRIRPSGVKRPSACFWLLSSYRALYVCKQKTVCESSLGGAQISGDGDQHKRKEHTCRKEAVSVFY